MLLGIFVSYYYHSPSPWRNNSELALSNKIIVHRFCLVAVEGSMLAVHGGIL
jgi:hypothetical protein